MSTTCGARTKSCRQCGHRYTKDEYDLWECPECGEPRACKRNVKAAGLRCRFHGGKSLSGIASPSYKHGRYSKYLPTHLIDRYQEAVTDPELLALRDEIALVDVRLSELLQRISTGETASLWDQLKAVYVEMQEALAAQDTAIFREAFTKLGGIIQQGGNNDDVWAAIGRQLEQRRKLVESERKRLVEMQQVITAEQAMTLLTAVVDVIRQNVTDRNTLAAISAAIKQLVSAGPRGGVDAITR